MTTLITCSTSGGSSRLCDARCYNAKKPLCVCICGGANHGAGLEQPTKNTDAQATSWLEQYRAAHPNMGDTLAVQLSLIT